MRHLMMETNSQGLLLNKHAKQAAQPSASLPLAKAAPGQVNSALVTRRIDELCCARLPVGVAWAVVDNSSYQT